MGRRDVVQLGPQQLRLDALRARPDGYGRLFAAAKAATGHGYCLCRPADPLQLVIRHREDRYFLARWPGTGPDHTPECPFHQPDPTLTGRSSYADAAIVEGPDGTTIRFDTPLTSSTAASVATGSLEEPGGGASSSGRCTLGLLGLLHFLWEDAGLNTWRPGVRRDWGALVGALADHVADTHLDRRALADILYCVPPYRPERRQANLDAFTAFLDRLRAPRDQIRRGLLLGELTEVTATRYGHAYRVAHLPGRLYTSTDQHGATLRRHGIAFARAATTARGRRIGLFLLERSPKGHAVVIDAAVMLTTGTGFLPADSSHELLMAGHLQSAGRAFLKPLRYDHTTLVFPDFVLTDTREPTVVEVWGLDHPEYLRRKDIKVAEYARTGTTLIGWRPPDPLPDLSSLRSSEQSPAE
ncbi:DUF1173 family protein [Nocardia yamanashiensis]|uniref:DUF1173 family protein n=1 Tax=Nocardia yamanashiensis TaxID=209247 RepID=UPI00082F91B7|nr:DUF1173 family protein [Nocardia yamanashiensis]